MQPGGLFSFFNLMESKADYFLISVIIFLFVYFWYSLKDKASINGLKKIIDESIDSKINAKIELLKLDMIGEIRTIRHDINNIKETLSKIVVIHAKSAD